MWLGKDPSRVQADPCPRIRARVSCSRLSPQRLGVLQRPLPLTPRPRDERSKPLFPPPPRTCSPKRLTSPHCRGWRRDPAGYPLPSATEGCPSPERLLSPPSPPSGGAPSPQGPSPCWIPQRNAPSLPPPPHPRALPPYRRARAGRYLSGGASRACGRRGLSWPHTPPAANPRPLSNPARVCPAAAASEGAPCEEGAQLRDPGL